MESGREIEIRKIIGDKQYCGFLVSRNAIKYLLAALDEARAERDCIKISHHANLRLIGEYAGRIARLEEALQHARELLKDDCLHTALKLIEESMDEGGEGKP